MMPRFSRRLLTLAACLLFLAGLALPQQALAQFYGDNPQDQQYFQDNQDQYFQPGPDEYGAPTQPDYTEGQQYVEESKLPPSETVITPGGRSLQLRLGGEKRLLPLNAAWGAGTGLLIGGWLALVNQGDNRATQRSIGMGIVLGTLLGLAVGIRTVLNPNAPQAATASVDPAHDGSHRLQPVVALNLKGPPQFGFRLRF